MPYTVLGEGITALFSLARLGLLRPAIILYTEMGRGQLSASGGSGGKPEQRGD